MGPRSSFRLKFLFALAILLLILYVGRGVWLTAMGAALIHDDGPAKADIAVLLAGDVWGFRMNNAAQMVKQGYVPKVLVSGPAGIYGMNEADLAIRWAVQQGYPADWFVALPHDATSTRAEALVLLAYLRDHNVHSFLLVTSNYHTARARRIFLKAEQEMGGGPEFHAVASNDKYYAPDSWWKSREGRKTAFMEWSKTVTGAFGI